MDFRWLSFVGIAAARVEREGDWTLIELEGWSRNIHLERIIYRSLGTFHWLRYALPALLWLNCMFIARDVEAKTRGCASSLRSKRKSLPTIYLSQLASRDIDRKLLCKFLAIKETLLPKRKFVNIYFRSFLCVRGAAGNKFRRESLPQKHSIGD